MPVKSGDFILANYTLKVKETGETVGTTLESVAKEKKLYRGEEHYEPFFIIVGEGWVPKGLDEALTNLEIGKATTIELPPDKGYGVRDPKKVRLVPLRKFAAEGVTPVPGLQVNMDGKTAQVRSVGAGRVQVDYNHPFAGKTLIYDITLEKIIEAEDEKVLNLVHKRIESVDQQKFSIKIENGKLQVEIPEDAFFLEGLQVAKRTLAADVEKYLPKVETVTFLETFKKPPTTPSAAPPAVAPVQPAPTA
ncbi:MAG: FKBP-type peptidyl-prolyl cis-trans isomerase [Candidatus Bathyarchaeia archaeon]